MGKTRTIKRHKAAITRTDLSRPVRLVLESGVLAPQRTFLDYGCGRGDDLRHLESLGISGAGWDPYFRPDGPREVSDIVNLGFVLNVIEDASERAETLKKAWELSGSVLLVSVQVLQYHQPANGVPHEDGIVTRRNTFQKYFDHSELRDYIQTVLEVEPVAAGLGIFLVFRKRGEALEFQASRRPIRQVRPKVRLSVRRYEEHQELLQPLVEFFMRRGRLPEPGELPAAESLIEEFKSLPKAFALVKRATGKELWSAAAEERRHDLLVSLALSRFGGRPRMSELPRTLQLDVRRLFGSYKRACSDSDEMLFGLGDVGQIAKLARDSDVGKLLPEHLYVHVSALETLHPMLRMYEGCARNFTGAIDDANIVKLHLGKPAVSYLGYEMFDSAPHPALGFSVKVDLANRRVRTRDFSSRENPPVLHRKELLVGPDYPHRGKFSRLTEQEVRHGLLEDSRVIGTREGWKTRLVERGFKLRGHRLVRDKAGEQRGTSG